jgi:hypothetical protein
LPDSHPAKRLVIAHAQCRRDCAGRDIPWHDREAIDEEWHSLIVGRRMTFSGFIYQYVCFLLESMSWIERREQCEQMSQEYIPRLRGLMDECYRAATANDNPAILEMVGKVRAYLDAWEDFIAWRDCEFDRQK